MDGDGMDGYKMNNKYDGAKGVWKNSPATHIIIVFYKKIYGMAWSLCSVYGEHTTRGIIRTGKRFFVT